MSWPPLRRPTWRGHLVLAGLGIINSRFYVWADDSPLDSAVVSLFVVFLAGAVWEQFIRD